MIPSVQNNWSALHKASQLGNLEIIEELINKSANVNATTSTKSTPLHWACLAGKLDASILLVRCGADVNFFNSVMLNGKGESGRCC